MRHDPIIYIIKRRRGEREKVAAGAGKFKQKFHPEWKNVYIAYKEDRLLPEILLDLSILCHKEAE